MCKRCISKGLQCGGYPDKFRFCGIASRGKWKDRDAPIDIEGASTSASASASPSSSNISKQIVFERSGISASASPHQGPVSQNSTPNEQSEIKTVLGLKETDLLLKHCKLIV
jgi:hypothetical protein